jgi:hypothetical protein
MSKWKTGQSIETAEDMAAYIETGDRLHDTDGNPVVRLTTCGTCGRTWDDARITGVTPTPGARCPFETWHEFA